MPSAQQAEGIMETLAPLILLWALPLYIAGGFLGPATVQTSVHRLDKRSSMAKQAVDLAASEARCVPAGKVRALPCLQSRVVNCSLTTCAFAGLKNLVAAMEATFG